MLTRGLTIISVSLSHIHIRGFKSPVMKQTIVTPQLFATIEYPRWVVSARRKVQSCPDKGENQPEKDCRQMNAHQISHCRGHTLSGIVSITMKSEAAPWGIDRTKVKEDEPIIVQIQVMRWCGYQHWGPRKRHTNDSENNIDFIAKQWILEEFCFYSWSVY